MHSNRCHHDDPPLTPPTPSPGVQVAVPADGSAGTVPPDLVFARVLKAMSCVSAADALLLIAWLTEWRNSFTRTHVQALRRQVGMLFTVGP